MACTTTSTGSTCHGWDDLPRELTDEVWAFLFPPLSPPTSTYQQLQPGALAQYGIEDRARMHTLRTVSRSFAMGVRSRWLSDTRLDGPEQVSAMLEQLQEEAAGQISFPIARYVRSLSVTSSNTELDALIPLWRKILGLLPLLSQLRDLAVSPIPWVQSVFDGYFQSMASIPLLQAVSIPCIRPLEIEAERPRLKLRLPLSITRFELRIPDSEPSVPKLKLSGVNNITALSLHIPWIGPILGRLLPSFSALSVLYLHVTLYTAPREFPWDLPQKLGPVFAHLRELHLHMQSTCPFTIMNMLKKTPLPELNILHIEGISLETGPRMALAHALMVAPANWQSLETLIYHGWQSGLLVGMVAAGLSPGILPALKTLKIRDAPGETEPDEFSIDNLAVHIATCERHGVRVDRLE